MRIGLLNNLSAGRNRKGVSRLLKLLSDYPEVAHVETTSAHAVPEALWELARQDVELLVVNGGDGTISHTLGEILGEGAFDGRVPDIAVLRGGRTNMTALDLGSRRNPVRSLADLIASARAGTLDDRRLERPVLRVQYGPGIHTRYGMFFGVGVVHRGIELVHRMIPRKRQGVFGASLVTGTLLARMAFLGESHGVLTPDKVGIMVDRSLVERGESTLVMASSLEHLFMRMQPFWGTGPGPVRFTSIASDASDFGRALPGILAGRPTKLMTERNGYTSRNAQRVDVRMDCGFTVDGELIGPSPDRIVSITANDVVRFIRA
jgi:hypothetical protein